jgi:hypothetical protein
LVGIYEFERWVRGMKKEIEKAIEFIKPYAVSSGFSAEEKGYFKAAITALEAQQADSWIPVECRLPTHRYNENGEPIEYIVMIRRAKEPTTLSIDSNGTWYDAMGHYYNIPSLMSYEWDVIAWHEMPEPWKEEQ